ncbi:hypothetical protein Tco_1058046, partial [Tanacetum coccineum]
AEGCYSYAGASLDRKSTTGGCQFLGCRLISWQCKKHTVVANSTTEAKYVAASSCRAQVLWIQNQLLDYGYALTINPTIYTSCIKQFWAPAKMKTVNEEAQIHALVGEEGVLESEALSANYQTLVSAATTTTTTGITKVEISLAQALAELKSAKPKVVVQEPVHGYIDAELTNCSTIASRRTRASLEKGMKQRATKGSEAKEQKEVLKRAWRKLKQESNKKTKVDDDV